MVTFILSDSQKSAPLLHCDFSCFSLLSGWNISELMKGFEQLMDRRLPELNNCEQKKEFCSIGDKIILECPSPHQQCLELCLDQEAASRSGNFFPFGKQKTIQHFLIGKSCPIGKEIVEKHDRCKFMHKKISFQWLSLNARNNQDIHH